MKVYRDVLARLEVIADVFADSLPELLGTHFLYQPHQSRLLPVRHSLSTIPGTQQCKIW